MGELIVKVLSDYKMADTVVQFPRTEVTIREGTGGGNFRMISRTDSVKTNVKDIDKFFELPERIQQLVKQPAAGQW